MSKQDCAIEQSNTVAVKTDDEFQNIENIILTVFKMLKECDQLMKIAENKSEKIGGESLE